MEYTIILMFNILCTAMSLSPPSITKVYRTDYEYNGRTKAFYKLHTEARRGWEADDVCKTEGASLMNPDVQDDIVQLHGMFKRYPDVGDYVFVAEDGRDHESAEEPSIIDMTSSSPEIQTPRSCNVVTRSGEIEKMSCYRRKPFICKVALKDAPYDSHCDVYGTDTKSLGYQYNAPLGSCYKISRHVCSWNEAYAECRAEGSHLVIINSEAESQFAKKMMQEAPRLIHSTHSWYYLAGFRANKPAAVETRVFKTIFNQTLEEAGYADWSATEPNNIGGKEYCGSLFMDDGKLNDVDCAQAFGFICEKEVKNNNHH